MWRYAKEINFFEVIRLIEVKEIAHLQWRSYLYKTLEPLGALILKVLAPLHVVPFGGGLGWVWMQPPRKIEHFQVNFLFLKKFGEGKRNK